MKKIISTSVLFFLVLALQVFAQMESIKEFPRAYESQEIWDLTPVWISNNEILVFYKNSTRDTIFSRRTTNSGQTWSNQKFEKAGEGINSFYYDMYLFKTSTGRLLFFNVISNIGINCYYSDNKGISWIESTQITGFFTVDLSVIEVEPGKLILIFLMQHAGGHASAQTMENPGLKISFINRHPDLATVIVIHNSSKFQSVVIQF